MTTPLWRHDRARWEGVSAGAHAAIAAPARPRASLRDDSRVAQLNHRIVTAPPVPSTAPPTVQGTTLLRGPVESELTPLVRMMDQPAVRATSSKRHLERVDDEL